ncbi:MAG: ABC transporter ATP-binding protein [Bacteroidia bacterium]|nr:ABC transporter ATP-binding protein [Bacteroidia bacterium]
MFLHRIPLILRGEKRSVAEAKKTPEAVKGSAFDWALIKRLLSYTRPYKGRFILVLSLTLLSAALSPLIPWVFQHILDKPTLQGNVAGVRTWILISIGLLLVRAAIMYLLTSMTGWLGQSVIRDIRIKVYDHLTGMNLRFFDKNPVGMLQTRTISDVETLNDIFSEGIAHILEELLTLIFIFAVMFATSWKLTLVVLTSVPVLLVATWIFKNAVKSAFQGVRKYVSLMNAFLQEHITGMLAIQIFNREKVEYDRFEQLNREHEQANQRSVTAYSIFFPVVEIVTALAQALLVWYGVGNVLNDYLSFGVLVAFLMYINMFFRPIRMLADQFNTLQLGMVSAERIFKILDQDDKIPNEGKLMAPPKGSDMQITFEKVWFAYTEQDWVLRDVSFEVQSGQKIAFVGSTGAGKSTIINLLTRFYEINRGKISINGHDIDDYELSQLRQLVGLVLQDVFLFSGTVYENITLNHPGISLEQAKRAAEVVGADKFIDNLPGGYMYNVQERGATLSAGQRQLIAFARVIAFDPSILILDEATSNIDTESEEMIQAAIDKVLAGRTSILVAHRLSTIQKADQILVMEKGQIVERGNHQSLLEQDGLYRRLYTLQFADASVAV